MNFAPNYTARYRLSYRHLGRPHVITFRLPSGTTLLDLDIPKLTIEVAFSSIASILYTNFQWISAVFCESGSDIWQPTTVPATVTGTRSTASVPQSVVDSSFTVSGRGTAGGKCRLVTFGAFFDTSYGAPGNDALITTGESAALGDFIDNITSGQFVAADDTVATWYPQATLKRNDHWLRQTRQGR